MFRFSVILSTLVTLTILYLRCKCALRRLNKCIFLVSCTSASTVAPPNLKDNVSAAVDRSSHISIKSYTIRRQLMLHYLLFTAYEGG